MQLSLFPEDNKYINANSTDYHECPICNEVKHESEYYRAKKVNGYTLKVGEGCKPCYNEKGSLKNYLHKVAPRKTECCECCGRNFKEHNLNIELDHNHTTKVFNGWLCTYCNSGLGKFKDDIERLEQAIAYLRRVNERT